MDGFKTKFEKQATKLFGSGWVWLVKTGGGVLNIRQLENAQVPPAGVTPLLVLDVWEHAYYIDHRNDRSKYVEAYWNIVNWNHANEIFGE